MSTAVYSLAPSQPGAEAEHPNPRGTSGAPCGGVPQGGHVPGQDPGLTHPHLMTRPVFYIPAPPPPPFMQYQWPMPFYNPFNPFSGMGYGMMMPPFPPAPYMEPPAYFVPHAPVQPVDYRRMAHAQPPSNSAPYLNQPRRPRPPPAGPVRETVSSGVQTEARDGDYHGGSPIRSCADSGRGTAPSSPTSSTSSNPKNSHGEGERCGQEKGLELRVACSRGGAKPGSQTVNPAERQSVQEKGKENCPVRSPSLKRRNVNLVRQENVETVDTPSKELSKKERRVSVPDILMSWGNGTPQEDEMAADENEKVPLYRDEVAHFQSCTGVNQDLLNAQTLDCDKEENEQTADPKSCYEPCEHSLNISIKVRGHDSVSLDEPSENAQTVSGKSRRKLNESVWSVESLPGFIPSKEWFALNTTAGHEVIFEMAEEAENAPPNDETVNRRSRRNSTMISESDSFISFSTPANKATAKHASNAACEPMIYKLQKLIYPPNSPICAETKTADTVKEIEREGTSELVDSPKRQSFTVEEMLEKSGGSDKGKTVILEEEKGDVEESSPKKGPEGGMDQLAVPLPLHPMIEVSPSKVDCGVQFPEPQTNRGNAGMNRKQFNKSADYHNSSTHSEGFCGKWPKKRHYQYRGKGPDRPHGQQEAFYPFHVRPGQTRGGKGRH